MATVTDLGKPKFLWNPMRPKSKSREPRTQLSVNFVVVNRETIMKKLSLFASVGAALVCAAVPASLNWSPSNVTLFSLDTAEARVGRPLTATSVAGVSRRVNRREYRRAAAGVAVGAAVVGGAAT